MEKNGSLKKLPFFLKKIKKSVDNRKRLCYNTIKMREGKPTKPERDKKNEKK